MPSTIQPFFPAHRATLETVRLTQVDIKHHCDLLKNLIDAAMRQNIEQGWPRLEMFEMGFYHENRGVVDYAAYVRGKTNGHPLSNF